MNSCENSNTFGKEQFARRENKLGMFIINSIHNANASRQTRVAEVKIRLALKCQYHNVTSYGHGKEIGYFIF
ncbi:hypothetical protein SDC9_169500 [bioreactor metagenome]|uniref:Uncharacterized protein n=1 Tax=bioreactor metagenome TaxID=1076179 RepID=A0A645G5C9_9ZZZZ